MNVNFMNPFIESAAEVLRVECNLIIERGKLSVTKSSLTTNEISVLLSLVGQVNGIVLYELSIATGLALVERVLGQAFPEFDGLAQSGVAELGNVITGRATVKLSEAGFSSNISAPTLIQGKNTTISTLDFARIVVPLKTEVGEIIVHLSLRETPEGVSSLSEIPLSLPVNGI